MLVKTSTTVLVGVEVSGDRGRRVRVGPGSRSLLDLLEPGWRRDLESGAAAAGLDVPDEVLAAAVRELGNHARGASPAQTARIWPACVIVAMARVAMSRLVIPDTGSAQDAGDDSKFRASAWTEWQRAAGLRVSRRAAQEWERAFAGAVSALGATPAGITSALTASPPLDAAQVLAAHAQPPREKEDETEDTREPDGTRLEPFGRGVVRVLVEAGTGADAFDTYYGSGDPDDEAEAPVMPEDITDPADPLLTFDQGGDPVGPVLPNEPVWVLHPEDLTLASDAPLRVLMTSRLPLTWRGWHLAQLDLRGVAWIGLEESRRRVVRGRTKPVLRLGPPLPGVTAAGRPVCAVPPSVLLPPGPGRWRVVVRRVQTGAVLVDLTVPSTIAPEVLWGRCPRPLLGELSITVGAVGRTGPGLRRTITVAEGLALACHPTTRLTTEQGLDPAEAVLTAPPGMTVSPSAVPFGEETAHKEVTCVTGPVTQRLTVVPPHIRLRVEPEPGSGGSPGPWHHAGPLSLTSEDLWRGGSLRLDLPGIEDLPPIEVIAADGETDAAEVPAQVLEPTRQGWYPLRRMLDTVRTRGAVKLVISAGGDRRATIARVSATAAYSDQWAIDAAE